MIPEDDSMNDQSAAATQKRSAEEWAPVTSMKPTNPKDAIGSCKVPFSLVPDQVVGEVALALLEGACKYGAANWRTAGVRASVYVDAARRHLAQFREGQDIDEVSGLSHITKTIAGLVVLRDSMLQGNWVDDRLINAKNLNWVDEQNALAKAILSKFPEPVAPCTQIPNVIDLGATCTRCNRSAAACLADATGACSRPLDEPLKPCLSCGGFAPRGCQDC